MTSELLNNEVGEQAGKLLSQSPASLHRFCESFGERLLHNYRIIERIDFLYDLWDGNYPTTEDWYDSISMGVRREAIWIRDRVGTFRHLSVVYLRRLDCDSTRYAIRLFGDNPLNSLSSQTIDEVLGHSSTITTHDTTTSKTQRYMSDFVSDHEGLFWNFGIDECVKIYPPSEGFYHLFETRAVCNMLVWTTNQLKKRCS